MAREEDKYSNKGMPQYYMGDKRSVVDSETRGGSKAIDYGFTPSTTVTDPSPTTTGVGGRNEPNRVKVGSNEIARDEGQAQNWEDKIFGFVKNVGEMGENIYDRLKHEYDYRILGKEDTEEIMDEGEAMAHLQAQKDHAQDYQTDAATFEQLLEGFDPSDTRSVEYLQSMIGAKPDGVFGPRSREALAQYLMQNQKVISPELLNKFDIGPESVYAQKYPHLQPGYKPPLEDHDILSDPDTIFVPDRPLKEYAPSPIDELPEKYEYREKERRERDIPLESQIIQDLKGL